MDGDQQSQKELLKNKDIDEQKEALAHILSLQPEITKAPIGVKIDQKGAFKVYAPYGLHDLFGLIVCPNKLLISRDVYEAKVAKWSARWPELEVISWDER
ncbi:nucleotidyltransferase family protein [Guptibacillus sedimenti]|uniref:nucleotidyltransferase family protein n=1 Tax=Guptibacillus sedimenti TaxID=3025680 RepID=UPI002360DB19|nr:nucleotidyltransferase family protein [Pseudalkalibacillus sedimenti]